MRIMLMSVPWTHSVQRYVALAHAQAMCLYCVCVVLEALFFLFSVKKLDDQEMCYPYESIY